MTDRQYVLNTMHLHNFKLFKDTTVYFEKKQLIVFDAPNGYGKTSIFDAIEYALTGSIKRIVQDKNINGKYSYVNNFLFRIEGETVFKDTSVDLELIADEDNKIKIRREVVEASGKENNPCNLKKHTKTYITVNNEEKRIFDDADKSNVFLSQLIGSSIQAYFDEYFYISQENRLSFLTRTEGDRMKSLEKLFLMDKELDEKKIIDSNLKKVKKLNDKVKSLKTTTKNEIKDLTLSENQKEQQQYQYGKRLLSETKRICNWDIDNPKIENKESYDKMLNSVISMESFLKNYGDYQRHEKNQWIDKFIENENLIFQYSFLLNFYKDENFQLFWEVAKTYNDMTAIVGIGLILNPDTQITDIEKVNLIKLGDILGIEYPKKDVAEYYNDINNCKTRMSKIQNAHHELQAIRIKIMEQRKTAQDDGGDILLEGQCPLCGHSWISEKELEQGILNVSDALNLGNNADSERIENIKKSLSVIYTEHFSKSVKEFITKTKFMQDRRCTDMARLKSQIEMQVLNLHKKVQLYGLQLDQFKLPVNDLEQWDQCLELLMEYLKNQQEPYTNSLFIEENEKYNFFNIEREFFDSSEAILRSCEVLKDNGFILRQGYLEQQYYKQQTEKKNDLQKKVKRLEDFNDRCENIYKKLEEFSEVYKNTFIEYKKAVTMKIRIPFYFYSGRILQSYRGGLGILIQSPNYDTIRFSAYDRRDHDVLYTMSSGQLTAIVLALTLTLNRLFGEGKLRCILIDDPVQTMDDLNMASFVELLRTDFSDCQFVIATHEENFSNYIRYKFEKHNLKTKNIRGFEDK